MPDATQTAVIIAVGEAQGVVAVHRRRMDRAAGWGVPAHVTVLYPFVAPTDVDQQVISSLAAVFAAASPFDCRFTECRWFGTDVLWLAPDPAQEFRRLTRAVVDRFPGYAPYGGEHDEVIPHLTVGQSRWATKEDLAAAEADIRPSLPITARIERALLIWGTDQRTPGVPWPSYRSAPLHPVRGSRKGHPVGFGSHRSHLERAGLSA